VFAFISNNISPQPYTFLPKSKHKNDVVAVGDFDPQLFHAD